MNFTEVQVRTRDDYRGAQEPAAVFLDGRWEPVEEVLDRWYEGSEDPTRMPMRYFRVRVAESGKMLLRHHEFFQAWSRLVEGEKAGESVLID